MKIKDIVLDFLNETALFEMAFERKVAIQHARNLQDQISRHIIKVCMYSESEYVDHWCNELNTWLWSIQNKELKGTNRPLDAATLTKVLFEEPMETIGEVQRKMNKIYREYQNVKIDDPDAASVHSAIYNIMNAVCNDIGQDKFNTIQDYL